MEKQAGATWCRTTECLDDGEEQKVQQTQENPTRKNTKTGPQNGEKSNDLTRPNESRVNRKLGNQRKNNSSERIKTKTKKNLGRNSYLQK